MTMRRSGALALLAACLALAGVDTVRAACIDETLTHAARLHEFEMLMMNVSLRCSLMGVDMRPHYEAMVSAHQAQFDGAAQRLQHYFATSGQAETRHGGLYDRYATLIAAALFALHPMRTESVVWAAERKDVLYAFFFLLSLICYVYFVVKDHRNYRYYLL